MSPAEAFPGRKLRTTLDLLRPPQFQPMERDELLERRFNKRFGAKPREFGPGDKIFARHRISQNWRPGNVVKKTGVIYDIKFADGTTNRYHANQIRPRQIEDKTMDQLNIFNDVFGLPQQVSAQPEDVQPQDEAVRNEADEDEIGRGVEEQNDGRIEQEEQPNEEMPITPRVYPRRPPDRYSPH
ncbi:hypothetical protein niasHT_012698 [Heterodera trifolii]|uniref:Uncharacterized protein n=1 Tax=Heterodera trifolii TaxID=157864 RepID=A0ABD2L4X8_9BILA